MNLKDFKIEHRGHTIKAIPTKATDVYQIGIFDGEERAAAFAFKPFPYVSELSQDDTIIACIEFQKQEIDEFLGVS